MRAEVKVRERAVARGPGARGVGGGGGGDGDWEAWWEDMVRWRAVIEVSGVGLL